MNNLSRPKKNTCEFCDLTKYTHSHRRKSESEMKTIEATKKYFNVADDKKNIKCYSFTVLKERFL